jgi:DNA-binding CsgD family transcriptional regulator
MNAKDEGELYNDLSDIEKDVLRLIALSYGHKEIAAQLQISVEQVLKHKSSGMEKLGLLSRIGIINYATRHGWL